MVSRGMVTRLAGGLVIGCFAAGSVVAAPSALAMQPYDECLANTVGAQTWGCYDLQVAPSRTPAASVELTWTLNTDAEGFDNANWTGGFVMSQWPVEGQWKKYPPLEEVNIPGIHDRCNGDEINTSNCYKVFSGPNGKMIIDFGPEMAGYVYEVYSHDYICSNDRSGCGPSGGSVDRYVFVFKAFQYKNKAGEVVKTANCPPRKQRKSACVPAATARIVDNIGGGLPVPFR